MKRDLIEMEGVVTDSLPNAMFKVELDNSFQVLGHISAKSERTKSKFCRAIASRLNYRPTTYIEVVLPIEFL